MKVFKTIMKENEIEYLLHIFMNECFETYLVI